MREIDCPLSRVYHGCVWTTWKVGKAMSQEEKATSGADCPFCAFWTAMKESEAMKHVRGIERESLLLARSLITSCLRTTERFAARAADKASGEQET